MKPLLPYILPLNTLPHRFNTGNNYEVQDNAESTEKYSTEVQKDDKGFGIGRPALNESNPLKIMGHHDV